VKNSNRFIQLKSRVDSLKDNLLPRTRIDGNYSEIEQDLIRGFILLVHAEIENFIEDRVEEKIDAVHNLWKTSRKKSHVISSMNSFCNFDLENSRHSKSDKENIEYRINLNVLQFKRIIFANHGIKRENILNLLLPIGIEINEIDDSWLNTMDNFGSDRGKIAHKKHSIQNIIDPESIKNEIYNNILPELKLLDFKLIKLS
jgi:hypothetical protein